MGKWLNRLTGGGGGASGVGSPKSGKPHPEDENALSPEGAFLRSRMRAILAEEPQLGRPAAFERAKGQLLEEIHRQGGPEATLLPEPKRRKALFEGCFDLPGFTLEQTLLAEQRLATLGKTDFGASIEAYTQAVQELEQGAAPGQSVGLPVADHADFSQGAGAAAPPTVVLSPSAPGQAAEGGSKGSGRGLYDVTLDSAEPQPPRRK